MSALQSLDDERMELARIFREKKQLSQDQISRLLHICCRLADMAASPAFAALAKRVGMLEENLEEYEAENATHRQRMERCINELQNRTASIDMVARPEGPLRIDAFSDPQEPRWSGRALLDSSARTKRMFCMPNHA